MRSIQPLTQEHLGAMRQLLAEYLQEFDPAADPEALWGDAFLTACLDGTRSGAIVAYVVMDAGNLAGFSVARLDRHWYRGSITVGMIEEFYIAPAFRAAGLGRALAAQTITSLYARGASSLMATVVQGNVAALGFWQRMGFSLEGFVLFHVAR
jgi:ribosomal protein S18 acetylase RimI-like enzyme